MSFFRVGGKAKLMAMLIFAQHTCHIVGFVMEWLEVSPIKVHTDNIQTNQELTLRTELSILSSNSDSFSRILLGA